MFTEVRRTIHQRGENFKEEIENVKNEKLLKTQS